VKLTEKGKRLGREHTWKDLLGGGAGSAPGGGSFGPAG
jgi:hypothetical protein